MVDMIKEVELLQRKSSKYDDLMKRSQEFATKLSKAAELINEVATELDPARMISTKERRGINYNEIAAEVYEKMQKGTEITTDLLTNTYGWDKNHIVYLFNKLRGMPNVDERTEGKRVIIYCRNDFKIKG